MAIKKEVVLSVDTVGAIKSVGDLQEKINELKNSISSLDTSGEDLDSVVQGLVQQMEQLTGVMDGLKGGFGGISEGIEESSAAITQLKTDSAEFQDEFETQNEKIKKSLDEMVEKLGSMNQESEKVKDSAKSIKDYEKEIEKLKDQLIESTDNTDAYIGKLKELRAIQEKINEVTADVKTATLSLGEQMKNVVSVSESLEKGFKGIQAGYKLLGEEATWVNEAVAHTQALTSMLKGAQGFAGMISSLTPLIKVMKNVKVATLAMNAAFKANPIMAIVSALAALVAVGVAVFSWISKNTKAAKEQKKAMDELNQSYDAHIADREHLARQQEFDLRWNKAMGASEEELFQIRMSHLDTQKKELETIRARVLAVEGETERYKELTKQLKALEMQRLRLEDDEVIRQLEEQNRKDEQDKADREAREKEEERKAQEAARVQIERRKKEKDEITQIEKEILDSKLSSYELQERELRETYEKQFALYVKHGQDTTALTEQYEAAQAELRAEELKRREEEAEQENEKRIQERAEQLAELETFYAERLERERLFMESLELQRQEAELSGDKESLEEIQQQITEARQEQELANLEFQVAYRTQLEEMLKDETVVGLERIELQNRLRKQENDILMAGLKEKKAAKDKEVQEEKERKEKLKKLEEAFQDNSASLMKESAKLLGENTVAGKAMAIAGATIDTYKAGSAALSTVPFPANIVAMATTIASGLNTVKSILSTSVPGASDTSSSASVPASAESVSIPEPEIEDLYQQPIEQMVTQLASNEQQALNQPSKVYVVETDISDTMARVQVAETESNF